MTFKITIVASVLILTSGCYQALDVEILDDEFEGFKPREELQLVTNAEVFDAGSGTRVVKDWAALTKDEQLRNLSLIQSEVSIFSVDSNGSLTYVSNSLTRGRGQYRVMIDFSRHRTDRVVDAAGELVGIGKVGVGLRLTADIQTRKSGINLAGMMPLAFAFGREEISGRISSQTIGLVAPDISKYFVTQTSLDQNSIAKAVESFGSVRVVMDDPSTEFEPYLLALSRVAPTDEQELVRRLTE